MAVRGSGSDVVDDTTPRTSTARGRSLAALVLGVVIVACLVVLGLRFAQDTATADSVLDRTGQVFTGAPGESERADRERVMAVASQFILRVNSYGPSDLDTDNEMPTYAAAVRAFITPKFQESFDSSVTLAEQAVSQSGVGRSSELFSSGVDTLDSDRATVLVAGSFINSYPNPQKPQQRVDDAALPFRLSVSLVKIEGDWLVDDFAPVQSTGDDNDQTTSEEIEGLTSDPTAPSGSQSSGKQSGGGSR